MTDTPVADQSADPAPAETPVDTPVETQPDTPAAGDEGTAPTETAPVVAPAPEVIVVEVPVAPESFLAEIRHELTAFEHDLMSRVMNMLGRIKPHHREKLFDHFKRHH